jgi:hypothetical protein
MKNFRAAGVDGNRPPDRAAGNPLAESHLEREPDRSAERPESTSLLRGRQAER